MKDFKKFLEHKASPSIDDTNYETCGQCWRNTIDAQVAQEYLDDGKVSPQLLDDYFKECEKKWQQTPLYLEVESLRAQGKKYDEIEKIMGSKGIEL